MSMFYKLSLTNMIYIDVETTMIKRNFSDLPQRIQDAWKYKFKRDKKIQEEIEDIDKIKTKEIFTRLWTEQAALYPEFAKIICISIGGYDQDGKFHVKAYHEGMKHGTDEIITNEIEILKIFKYVLDNPKYNNKTLIAHNGKGFDYPFLIKRYLVNGMTPPKCLHIYGKKPWEITLLDSQEIWQFGSRSYTSLDTIASVFGLPSPKKDMDGSEVWKFYYDLENGKEKIGEYCNNDVISLAQVMLAMVGNKDLEQPKFVE